MATFSDRVKETTSTEGTGTYDLDGAQTGFQSFVDAGLDTLTVKYMATDGTDWEVGEGVVTDAAPDTLTRATIEDSSNSGSAVNWSAGSKDIGLVDPASFFNEATTFFNDTIADRNLTGVTISNAATAVVSLPTGYDAFELLAYFEPASDAVNLLVEIEDSTANHNWMDHRVSLISTPASSENGGSGETTGRLCTNVGNATAEGATVEMSVIHARDTAKKTVLHARTSRENATPTWNSGISTVVKNTTQDDTQLTFSFSSGNIDSGFVKIRGIIY